jgi:hypothetical protein
MNEVPLLQPPEIVEVAGKVLFLAGPIQGAPDWQAEASHIIRQRATNLTIASPRKAYGPGEFVYERQVDWETHYLRRAAALGGILFWLAKQVQETPGRAYAQTSRFELGEWKRRHETESVLFVVGVEKGFGNERYIRRRLAQDCPEVPIMTSLEDTCLKALEKLGQ